MAASASQAEVASSSSCANIHSKVTGQLNCYWANTKGRNGTPGVLQFWHSRLDTYNELAATAERMMATPALEAYVKPIFPLCGTLTNGCRNCIKSSLRCLHFINSTWTPF